MTTAAFTIPVQRQHATLLGVLALSSTLVPKPTARYVQQCDQSYFPFADKVRPVRLFPLGRRSLQSEMSAELDRGPAAAVPCNLGEIGMYAVAQ